MKAQIHQISPSSSASIGINYPIDTNRLLHVSREFSFPTKKVALAGDSTIDNGFWVQRDRAYWQRTGTVRYQVAKALAEREGGRPVNYDIGCFAVDGAETGDLNQDYELNAVVGPDADHPGTLSQYIDYRYTVNQLDAIQSWQPNIAILSVGGNNYRVPLQDELRAHISITDLLTRQTPEAEKQALHELFSKVKAQLLREYLEIVDRLVDENPNLDRLILMSQYYPELTQYTLYFIYTGFAHIAHAEGLKQTAFELMQSTMNELYREIAKHAMTKGKEVVMLDLTSSMSPLDNNHTCQIEPNERGAKIIGQLMAEGIEYQWPSDLAHDQVPVIRYDTKQKTFHTRIVNQDNVREYSVKPIEAFIRRDRYKHVNHFFSPQSSLATRYESAYHMILGKSFDLQYRGVHALGLVDISLVTYVANYLWSVALDQDLHIAFRVMAGAAAAPIMLAKYIIGLALLSVLTLPILGYHQLAKQFKHEDEAFNVDGADYASASAEGTADAANEDPDSFNWFVTCGTG